MPRSFAARWITAGAVLAFVDFCWAVVLTVLNDRPPMSVWNGVASTAFGAEMLQAGLKGILIGLAMHVTVAFTWSGIYLGLETNIAALERLVSTRAGKLAFSAVYGPFIWVVMSCAVIPTMTGNAPNINTRWIIQLVGHVFFVGIPIVFGGRR